MQGFSFLLLRKLQKRVMLLAPASNMTFSLVCILFRRLLLGLFTQDELCAGHLGRMGPDRHLDCLCTG